MPATKRDSATLYIHGFHTDCGNCGKRDLTTSTRQCPHCHQIFMKVQTEYMYKLGKPERLYDIKEWEHRV